MCHPNHTSSPPHLQQGTGSRRMGLAPRFPSELFMGRISILTFYSPVSAHGCGPYLAPLRLYI